jgi:protein-disulfide isomerase
MNEEVKSEEKKKDTITLRKDDLWKYSTFVLGALLILGLFVFVLGDGANNEGDVVGNNQAPSAPSVPTQPSQVSVSVDDDPFLGSADAPVTIIEFSDYQCPFCSRFWSQTLPSIKSEYIDTGKVKFVYRDFPLDSIHPFATPAAIAAECVREKGGDKGYFEYHDKIFAGQGVLSDSSLKAWAEELGYNIDSCLDSKKYLSEVQKDLADGQAAGVRGTPGFIILKGDSNVGTPLSGAQPFAAFQQIIEANL